VTGLRATVDLAFDLDERERSNLNSRPTAIQRNFYVFAFSGQNPGTVFDRELGARLLKP
jgi:hypothetical protein